MAAYTTVLYQILCCLFIVCKSQIELDERFLEYRKHGMWLVEFYAPWCGHCKKLDPIYREVARELQVANSEVKVAKVDCTRYSQIASEFSVKGFPTIIFINGDKVYTHRGDRTKDDILEFVLKAQGPTIRKLSSVGKLNEALGQHSGAVFFLFIGDDDQHDDLYRKYLSSAEIHAVHCYFYFGKKHILDERNVKRHPSILVFKDGQYQEFDPPGGVATADSLEHWINRERYATFPKISGPGLNEMAGATKYLVILAAEQEDLNDPSSASSRLYRVMKEVAFGQKSKFHSQFQFVWMPEVETVNSIAMTFMTAPVFMVLDTGHHIYFMTSSPENLTLTTMAQFLSDVADGKEQAYGGTGFLMSVKRVVYDLVSMILSIWQASRWLFLLMFGLPTLIISFICYSLCCMEPIDDLPDEEDEDDDKVYEINAPLLDSKPGALPSYDQVQGDIGKQSVEEKKKN